MMASGACQPIPHSPTAASSEYAGKTLASRVPLSLGTLNGDGRANAPRDTSAGPNATLESCPTSEPRCGAASSAGWTRASSAVAVCACAAEGARHRRNEAQATRIIAPYPAFMSHLGKRVQPVRWARFGTEGRWRRWSPPPPLPPSCSASASSRSRRSYCSGIRPS